MTRRYSLPVVLTLLFFTLTFAHADDPNYAILADQVEKQLAAELKKIADSGAPVKFTDLAKSPIPDSENASLIIEKAFPLVTAVDTSFASDVTAGKVSLSDPAIYKKSKALLAQSSEALRLVHAAAAMPRHDWKIDWSQGFGLTFPHYAKLRATSRLLAFEAAMLAHDGKADAALNACRDNFRLSNAADDPTLIGQLVRYAIIAIARGSLERTLAEVHPSQAASREFAKELAAMDLIPGYIEALKVERVSDVEAFNEVKKSPDPISAIKDLTDENDDSITSILANLPRNRNMLRWVLASDELTYLRLMSRIVGEAPLPYRTMVKVRPSMEDEVGNLTKVKPPAVISALLIPVLTGGPKVRDRAAVNLDLAQIVLLLSAYRAEHGAYPSSLAVLGSLPLDPFSGKPYIFRHQDKGFLLYSIGPDLKDNKGAKMVRLKGDMVVRMIR